MILLNPRNHDRFYPDERSREIMRQTISVGACSALLESSVFWEVTRW